MSKIRDELKAEALQLSQKITQGIWGKFNETQLWYLYLGLSRLNLVPELKVGTERLANQIREYGKKKFGWQE